MCINVFDSKINIIYRLICLFTFLFVIIFVNNISTVFILFIIIFLLNIRSNDYKSSILLLLTFLIFIICYYFKKYDIFRIMVIVNYSYYFINYEKEDKEYKNIKKGEKIDKIEESKEERKEILNVKKQENKLIRFGNNINYYNSDHTIFYIFIHLFLLFISIVIG